MNTTTTSDTTPPTTSEFSPFARGAIIGEKKCERWTPGEKNASRPLHWRRARHIELISDLFHRDVPFEFIDRVFAVMGLCPQHTFQVLTKRPERMVEYMAAGEDNLKERWAYEACPPGGVTQSPCACLGIDDADWPLPNVWLGTSCENQAAADHRIPHLLKCPAAVRFLSCEPLLGKIELQVCDDECPKCGGSDIHGLRSDNTKPFNWYCAGNGCGEELPLNSIDWVIVGGESGPGARSCNIEWVRSIVQQCKTAAVPCFVKQLGALISGPTEGMCYQRAVYRNGDKISTFHPPIIRRQLGESHFDKSPSGNRLSPGWDLVGIGLTDKKGADPSEWPEDIRVREMPEVMA